MAFELRKSAEVGARNILLIPLRKRWFAHISTRLHAQHRAGELWHVRELSEMRVLQGIGVFLDLKQLFLFSLFCILTLLGS